MDDSRVRKASDLLGSLLSPKAAAQADGWSRFFGFWTKAAGENLAAHSRPVDVRNGIVYVETTHPGWIQLLQMEQNRILDTIRRTFPELGISGIAFRLARDGSLPGTVRITRASSPETADAGGLSPEGQADGICLGDQTRAGSGMKPEKMPSVAQTIRGVTDDSFRSILSSLASTLNEANREAGVKARATTAEDGHNGGV
ncbi:MAG: hypothetical protein A2Z96_07790 [Spirochaetes bacterium GWB1_48_6]|nr:MAG: hypothetical protein A2Z96_07790 [Spirochaetes bacterium GWB1_48_6]